MARIGVIPDSFADLNNPDFTTCLLIESFMRKGHEVRVTTIDHLYLHNNQALARWKPGPFGEETGAEAPLSDFDLVLMRKDPPFDEAYVNALFILDYANTPVLNDPRAVRLASEKIFPLQWPDLAPETYVTRDPEFILDLWRREKRDWILKPTGSYDSQGVRKLSVTEPQAETIILEATENGKRFVVVQEFLKNLFRGEKKIQLLDGKPAGWFMRVPAPGSHLAGSQHGGQLHFFDLDERDHQIIERIGPYFTVKTGLPYVGVDIVDGKIIEINVTAPSGIAVYNRFTNGCHQDQFTEFFLSVIKKSHKYQSVKN